MQIRWALLLGSALLLGGCATPYAKNSLFGGYWDKAGPGELIEVGFNGNGYIRSDRVQVYLLYRSAEIAKSRGKPFLSVYPSIAAAIQDKPVTEASASSLAGKPFGKVFVLLHDNEVDGALQSEEVLNKYASEVRGATAKGAAP